MGRVGFQNYSRSRQIPGTWRTEQILNDTVYFVESEEIRRGIEDFFVLLEKLKVDGKYFMPLPLWFEFEGRKLTVWGGFKTDYASIPRGLWFLLAPRQIRRAAILHDAGYRILGFLRDQKIITNRQFSIFRETFDDLFFEAMGHVDPSISAFKRCAAFRSVRAFGWMRGAGLNDATIIQNNFPVVDRIISPF